MINQEVMGDRVICDGLLCSILHSMSSTANFDECVSVIERESDENEIMEAKTKLFIFFDTAECPAQKKKIMQITQAQAPRN